MPNNYIIIPARMSSKRLPGKPLLDKTGKYLIQHTWEMCKKAQQLSNGNIKDVVIATEDLEIQKACESFGATVMMTYECRLCGTERAVVAASKLINPYYILSVQAEYPRIHPKDLIALFQNGLEHSKSILTMAYFTQNKKLYYNHNRVKVVVDFYGQALYFSRAAIPAYVNIKEKFAGCHVHVGVYGFVYENMLDFYKKVWHSQSDIGLAHFEQLEQLRWLFFQLQTFVQSCTTTISIDSMEDYMNFVREESWAKPLPSESNP